MSDEKYDNALSEAEDVLAGLLGKHDRKSVPDPSDPDPIDSLDAFDSLIAVSKSKKDPYKTSAIKRLYLKE